MAILAGFEQSRGEIVITLDADLQNPPEKLVISLPRCVKATTTSVRFVNDAKIAYGVVKRLRL